MTDKPSLKFCVYCGSREGKDADNHTLAGALGALMADHKIGLVYGGGSVGLMGILADAVLANDGHVTGIIPRFLDKREVGARHVSTYIQVDTMHERKARMIAESDALIALPGGLGTYDELFEAMTWRQLGLHDKPIYLLGAASYWRPFLDLLQHIEAEGFAWGIPANLVTYLPNLEALAAHAGQLDQNRTPINGGSD